MFSKQEGMGVVVIAPGSPVWILSVQHTREKGNEGGIKAGRTRRKAVSNWTG